MNTSTALAPVAPASLPTAQADNDAHLIQLWLNTKRSAATRAEYRRDIDRFRAFADFRPLPAVRLNDLQQYAESLKTAGLAPNTQQRKIAAVKSLFAFARKINYVAFDIGQAVTLNQAANRLSERILSEAELFGLIGREENTRNRLLLLLSYATGGRVSEIVALKWRNLQSRDEGGQATLYGKGGKTRVVLIPAKLWADLQTLRADAADDAPVFPSRKGKGHLTRQQAFRIVKAAAKRVGLTAVSPHWMRHAHASHALERGASVALVSESLGHSDVKITSRYLHARPGTSSSTYLALN